MVRDEDGRGKIWSMIGGHRGGLMACISGTVSPEMFQDALRSRRYMQTVEVMTLAEWIEMHDDSEDPDNADIRDEIRAWIHDMTAPLMLSTTSPISYGTKWTWKSFYGFPEKQAIFHTEIL